MTNAQPSEVKALIDTGSLSPSVIQGFISDAHDEITREGIDTDIVDPQLTNLEKYLAALKLVQSPKAKAVSEDSVGDSSLVYEASTVQWLKGEVSKRDPTDSLASSVIRDTNRHVTSTDQS